MLWQTRATWEASTTHPRNSILACAIRTARFASELRLSLPCLATTSLPSARGGRRSRRFVITPAQGTCTPGRWSWSRRPRICRVFRQQIDQPDSVVWPPSIRAACVDLDGPPAGGPARPLHRVRVCPAAASPRRLVRSRRAISPLPRSPFTWDGEHRRFVSVAGRAGFPRIEPAVIMAPASG